MKFVFIECEHRNPVYKTIYMGIEMTSGVMISAGHLVMTEEEAQVFKFITTEGTAHFLDNECQVEWRVSSHVHAFMEGVDAQTV